MPYTARPGIPDRLEREIALLIAGVATDVVGAGLDAVTAEHIEQTGARYGALGDSGLGC